jgi:hypothetical protein
VLGHHGPIAPRRTTRLGPVARREGGAFLELLGLTTLAITQPLLDVYSNGAEVFLTQRASGLVVVLFALAVALVPALVLEVLGAASGLLGPAVRRAVHLVTLGLLGGAVAIQAAKEATDLGRWALLAILAVAAVGVVALLARFPSVRSWIRLVSVASVAFVALFLLSGPIQPLLAGDEGGESATAGNPVPVVVLLLDELPTSSLLDGTGHIDRDLFPHVAALADDATWYRNNTTVATETNEAVPAILTGRYPEPESLPTTEAYPDNLFTALDDRYDVSATELVTRLCPSSVCDARRSSASSTRTLRRLLDSASDIWRERVSPSRSETSPFALQGLPYDPNPPGRVRTFLEGLEGGGGPSLDLLHVLFPHQPFHFLPSGRRYEAPEPPDGSYIGIWSDDVAAENGRIRHELQLQQTDHQVGLVIDRLKELGTYDETLLVVTADHGAGFEQGHAIRTLDDATAPSLLWAPLLLKPPGQTEGRIDDTHTRSIDLVPTIADVLDLDLPYDVDGRSVLDTEGLEPVELRALEAAGGLAQPTEGRFRTFDVDGGFRQVLQARAAPTDEGDPSLRLFRTGRFGDLIGQPVAPMRGPAVDGVTADLETPSRVRAGPDDRVVPAWVAASLPEGEEGDVAVALGGRVAAVRPLRPEVGRSRFWAMVPETMLTEDEEEVELFRVEGDPAAPRLRPIALDGAG